MYTARDVSNVLGVPSGRLRSYLRAGVVTPEKDESGELRFSFRDLVVLRKVEGLVEKSVPARKLNWVLRQVQDRMQDNKVDGNASPGALSGLDFDADGNDVVVNEGHTRWSADSGQVLLDFVRPRVPTPTPGAAGSGAAGAIPPGHAAIVPLTQARATRQQKKRLPVETPATAQECFERGCALEENDPAQARECYRRAIEFDPNHADAHVNLGRLMHESGHPDSAQIHYRVALSVRPDDPTASFNLGVALEDTGNRDEAIRSYQASINADPSNADAHYNLARLLEQSGRPDAAIRHLMIYRQLTRARR